MIEAKTKTMMTKRKILIRITTYNEDDNIHTSTTMLMMVTMMMMITMHYAAIVAIRE